jgi:hypothetical protein
MKQTAVEWLCEKYHLKKDIEIVKEAIEMEKEQIIEARVNGMVKGIEIGSNTIDYDLHKTHEQYYTETYENKK